MKTLKLFTALCFFNFTFIIFSNAQIIYTDVNPDATLTTSYNLDLNNDGIIDFVITHVTEKVTGQCAGHHGKNQYVRINPMGSNQVVEDGTLHVVRKLVSGMTVSSSSISWSGISNQIIQSVRYVCDVWNGHWNSVSQGYSSWNSSDGYIGLKIIASGNTYYGWVRMIVSTGAVSFTIRDYAYDSTPDHSILAGAISGARFAEENSLSENDLPLSIYPNPISHSTTISFSLSQSQNVSLKIFDVNGRLVSTLAAQIFDAGENELVWNAAEVNAGIYFLQFQSGNVLQTKKLIVAQ